MSHAPNIRKATYFDVSGYSQILYRHTSSMDGLCNHYVLRLQQEEEGCRGKSPPWHHAGGNANNTAVSMTSEILLRLLAKM